MKNALRLIGLIVVLNVYNLSYAQPYLQIHHISGGYGDATLIIAVDESSSMEKEWDTCVVLIDGQSSADVGEEVWRYTRDTLQELFPMRKKIDYIVVSHMHGDHFLGAKSVIENAISDGWKIDKIFLPSMISTAINPGGIDDDCYDEEVNEGTGTRAKNFIDYVKACGVKYGYIPIKNDLFYYKNMLNMKMECIVAGGATINPTDNTVYSFLVDGKVRNENDLSYGFLIGFTGFHYTTMGDLGGTTARYTDGETYATNYLLGHFNTPNYHLCANKISHHGSSESTTQYFVENNNPTIPVIPASLKSYGQSALPTESTITNLLMNGSSAGLNTTSNTKIAYTFIPKDPYVQSSYWTRGNLQSYNDVILKIGYPPILPIVLF
jgi:beta-lactamase superfamily II metal-dependent hydrolase